MLKREQLRPAQTTVIGLVDKNPKCGIFLGMGGGKTASTLTIASDFLDDFFVTKVLIVAPLKVARSVWIAEAQKWEHLKHLKMSVCVGNTPAKRLKGLRKKADIYVINKDCLKWLIEKCDFKWDMVILDESSGYKSHDTARFKSIKKICHKFTSIVLLSGTPAPKGQIQLWSQVYLLDQGKRLGRTISAFRDRFCRKDYSGFNWVLRPGAGDEINELIKDICFTIPNDAKTEGQAPITHEVEFDSKTRKMYDEFEKEMVFKFFNVKTAILVMLSIDINTIPLWLLVEAMEKDIASATKSVLQNKLIQICNGAIYDEDKKWHQVHNLKINALAETVEDNPTENFLVGYTYKSDLEKLKSKFPEARVLKTTQDEDDWNAGKIKMLLAHPASAGHGLNLQFGGSTIVWFGIPWSLELYQQFNCRLDRPGQTQQVKIIHLVVRDSVDEDIMKSLGNDKVTQEQMLEYLKVKLLEKYDR